MTKINNLIATFFFIGRVSSFPGTLASFVSMLAFYLLFIVLSISWYYQVLIIFLLIIVGVPSSFFYSQKLGLHDPSECVIDEVTGMGISLLLLPDSVQCYILSFLLFRLFDIFKPSVIFHSQSLGKGWGIMLDDIIAGLFALSITHGLLAKSVLA